MSRYLDREEREAKPEQQSSCDGGLARSGGSDLRPRATVEPEVPSGFGANQRERVIVRDREYRVRPSEAEALRVLGTFRVVREDDLTKGVYGGCMELAQADARSLRRQGLIRSVNFQSLRQGPARVHTLTGEGYKYVVSRSAEPPNYFYWGFLKPAEVDHDSLLYRAYLHHSRRIRDAGGAVRTVTLDAELKRRHFSRVSRPGTAYRAAQGESAKELHLPVIDGHVVFPDFRIEYEDDRGELSRVDVEVATENYRERHIAAKLSAGFAVYATSNARGLGLKVESGLPLKGNVFPMENRTVFLL